MIRSLLFLSLLAAGSVYSQVKIKVDENLRYRIGPGTGWGKPDSWDTLCTLSGVISDPCNFHVNIGTVNYGTLTRMDFSIFNDSAKPFFISNAYWGEPHIAVEWSKEPIIQAKSGRLTYTCHAGTRREGWTFTKSSTAYIRDRTIHISFRGTVLPAYLWLDSNCSVLERRNVVKTSFTIAHRLTEEDTSGFMVDSVKTDAFTKVDYKNSSAGPNGFVKFDVTCRPSEKTPQRSRVTVYINGMAVEHDLYILERHRARGHKTKTLKTGRNSTPKL